MNNNFLHYAVRLSVISLIAMIAAMLFTNLKYPTQSQGTLVFAETYRNGAELDKIVIQNATETITLELRDNLWRVRESGGYYAGTYLLNTLLSDLNTSTFYSRQENTPQTVKGFNLEEPQAGTSAAGTRISAYVGDRLQNSLLLGKTTDNGLYHFAKLDNDEIWLISGRFELPAQAYSWLLQPILELPASLIETIRFYDKGMVKSVGRKEPNQKFTDDEEHVFGAEVLTGTLERLIAENVLDSVRFAERGMTLTRRMEVITFQGLVFYLDIYADAQNETWIRITLSTTPLPMSLVNDYIKDNKFLYDGWYFKLPPETAGILTPASLI